MSALFLYTHSRCTHLAGLHLASDENIVFDLNSFIWEQLACIKPLGSPADHSEGSHHRTENHFCVFGRIIVGWMIKMVLSPAALPL